MCGTMEMWGGFGVPIDYPERGDKYFTKKTQKVTKTTKVLAESNTRTLSAEYRHFSGGEDLLTVHWRASSKFRATRQ